MAQTTSQIRNQAAEKLGLLGTGQTIRSAISNDLDQAYAEVYATLQTKGLASFGISTTSVPDELVEPIVSWVAGIRAARYGLPSERYQRVMLDYQGNPGTGAPSAEDRIRAIVALPKAAPAKIQNF